MEGQHEAHALVVSPNEEDFVKNLSPIVADNEKVSAGLSNHYKTYFDKFQSGDHQDDFCYVIFSFLGSYEEADIELHEDMFKYYGAAPVCAWVVESSLSSSNTIKKLVNAGHRVFKWDDYGDQKQNQKN